MIRLIFLSVIFLIDSLFAQGVYRDSNNYLRVKFSEPILVKDLIVKEKWLVTNSSAQIINITGIGFNDNIIYCYGAVCEDTASMYAVLRFDKLQWGIKYNIQVINVYDTAENSVNLEFDDVYWSFDNERKLLIPITFLFDKNILRLVNAIGLISNPSNPPLNVIDGDITTRWSVSPIPQSIIIETNRNAILKEVSVAWYNWNFGRIYIYDIGISVGGVLWTQVATGVVSSISNMWTTSLIPQVSARFIRITILSQNQGTWASILEVKVKE